MEHRYRVTLSLICRYLAFADSRSNRVRYRADNNSILTRRWGAGARASSVSREIPQIPRVFVLGHHLASRS